MSRAGAAALLVLLLAGGARAGADLDVPAVALSLGRNPTAAARLTYDRRKAEGGGFIYAVPRAEQADDEAVRVSEGLLITEGGVGGRGAVVARAHGVPALLLARAAWKNGALSVEAPALGAPRRVGDAVVQVAEGDAWRTVPEGAVVTLLPEDGLARVVSDDRADEALALADALRGYEGLQDAQAVLNWYAARADGPDAKALAAKLYSELAARVAEGLGKPGDAKVLAKALGQDGKEACAREGRRWTRVVFPQAAASLSQAGAVAAVDRLAAEADARWRGVAAVCAAAGQKAPPPAGERLDALARGRRGVLEKRGPLTLEQAAADAGAAMPAVTRLPPELYRRFVAETGLSPLIDDVATDASLRLSQKSDRIAQLFADAKLTADSDIGKEIAKAFPAAGPARVAGEDETIDSVSPAGAPAAVKRAWASSWNPGPLGARKRAGGLEPSPTVTLLAQPPGETGTLYSRDPAGGRRRVTVDWSGDEYVLSPEGRALIPPAAPAARRLSPERLKSLAKLAAALDAHFGGTAQASFAFSIKGEPILLDAKFLPSR